MREKLTACTTIVQSMGILGAVNDLENTLNVILLVLSIIGILLTIGFNVYDRIRKKDYKGPGKEIRNGLEELKQMSEELKGKEDEK